MKKRIIPLLLASLSMFAIAGASAAGKELKAVGLTVGDMANPFFVAMGKGTEEAAKKINPNVKVTALSSKYDLNTQVGQIENFIANKVDLILINAVDPKAIAPVVKKAKAAGILKLRSRRSFSSGWSLSRMPRPPDGRAKFVGATIW